MPRTGRSRDYLTPLAKENTESRKNQATRPRSHGLLLTRFESALRLPPHHGTSPALLGVSILQTPEECHQRAWSQTSE